MLSVADYSLVRKNDCFFVEGTGTVPPCPLCGGDLRYRDRKPRIMKSEGGIKCWLKIRRFRCSRCQKLHSELPDCLVPRMHYRTEVISGVLDGIVTENDSESEDYPCVQTMHLWIRWFQMNLQRMEGYLRLLVSSFKRTAQDTLYLKSSPLSLLRNMHPDWLEKVIRAICNSGGFLIPVSSWVYAPSSFLLSQETFV